MITTNKQIENLCNLINEELITENKQVTLYLIGGGALMFYGAKTSTKDLDIILKDEKDYNLTKQILEKTGFIPSNIEPEYVNFELEHIYIKEKYRLDIFNKLVCGKLQLSENMINRSKTQLKLSNLKLNTVSLEDIFVFK
jgi:pantothenate kinase